jgi:hypothetical protein
MSLYKIKLINLYNDIQILIYISFIILIVSQSNLKNRTEHIGMFMQLKLSF